LASHSGARRARARVGAGPQESERGRWQAGVSGGLRKGRGRGLGCGMRGDDGCVTAVNGGRWESGAEDGSGGRRGRARVWTLTLLS
jgi:hypothetical protein